jgi:hypothetical protein
MNKEGLSLIVYHNNAVDVCNLSEEEHNERAERIRKAPGTLYAFDRWCPHWVLSGGAAN